MAAAATKTTEEGQTAWERQPSESDPSPWDRQASAGSQTPFHCGTNAPKDFSMETSTAKTVSSAPKADATQEPKIFRKDSVEQENPWDRQASQDAFHCPTTTETVERKNSDTTPSK
jgi:hypothetical protein